LLVVLFHAGAAAYALPCRRVLEVVPFVTPRPYARSPGTPASLVGLIRWRGRPLPVLDLSILLAGRPCEPRLSTRILVAEAPHPERGHAPLGLLAERVTEVEPVDDKAFARAGLTIADAPYLGPVFPFGTAGALHQLIELDALIPAEIRGLLDVDLGAGDAA
jgi:chemotaxis-related protein WspB